MDVSEIFDIQSPINPLPVIFDSPHSGQNYPPDFKYNCPHTILRQMEDAYIDTLFHEAPKFGAHLLCALFPRSYIDVNRARDDIDPHILNHPWPFDKFGAICPTSRSDAGIGLIPRLVKPGIPIYSHKIGAEEIMHRIMTHYDPYHQALENLLEKAYYTYGQFWHINCHSMPAHTAFPKTHKTFISGKPLASDIVLGDRDGTTCSPDFMRSLKDYWQRLGYRVTINDPFKGVELVARYAQPTRGKNSLQIEINRALFMNEETGEKSKNFETVKNHISGMIAFITTYAQSKMTRLAAD